MVFWEWHLYAPNTVVLMYGSCLVRVTNVAMLLAGDLLQLQGSYLYAGALSKGCQLISVRHCPQLVVDLVEL